MNDPKTIRPRRRTPLVLLWGLAMAGCSTLTTTAYQTPPASVPPAWQQPTASTAERVTNDRWWQRFDDPALTALVEEALARNNALASAAVRVRRAQLAGGLVAQQEKPVVSGSLGASTNRRFDDNAFGSGRDLSSSLSVSYEVDLWGRLGHITDSARWEAEATEQDRQAIAAALVATTAQTYWQLAFLNQRIASAEESLAFARRTLALVRVQREAGSVSGLELAEAEQSLANQQAARASLEQQRAATRHALALLLDRPPQAEVPDPRRLPAQALPEVAAGLPMQVMARRPDLRAAEARLRGGQAAVDASEAGLYPALGLTAGVGSASRELVNLLSNPVGSLAAALTLPFLQWQERRLDIGISQADFDAAAIDFRQTLYDALGEVEDALSARTQLAVREQRLREALDAALRAERLYEVRWRAGAEPLRVLLEAQESRRQAELALDANRLDALSTHAALVLALGGDALLPTEAPAARLAAGEAR